MPIVNPFLVVCCEPVAAKGAKRNKGYRKGHQSNRKPIKAYICKQLKNTPPNKIPNSTSTDVAFVGAKSSRIVVTVMTFYCSSRLINKKCYRQPPFINKCLHIVGSHLQQRHSRQPKWKTIREYAYVQSTSKSFAVKLKQQIETSNPNISRVELKNKELRNGPPK